jgi:hypothetical protein
MTKPRTLPVEQEHHRKAFELYASQGHGRSYEKVAEALSVSVAGVKKWGRTFDWRRRLQERELETARQIADRTLQTTISDQERYRKIVRMAVTKLAKAIAEDRVKLQAADLDRLIRLEDYLSHAQGGGAFGAVATVEELLSAFERLCAADQDRIVGRLEAQEGAETAPGSG